MLDEYHKPFVKSLAFIIFCTVTAVFCNRYIAQYYTNHSKSQIYTSNAPEQALKQ